MYQVDGAVYSHLKKLVLVLVTLMDSSQAAKGMELEEAITFIGYCWSFGGC